MRYRIDRGMYLSVAAVRLCRLGIAKPASADRRFEFDIR